MESSFQEQLMAFIDRLQEENQAAARQAIAAVLDTGVVTYPAWLTLIADLQAPGKLRQTACWVIGLIGNGDAFAALFQALHDADPRMRACAAGSLAHLRSRVKSATGEEEVNLLIQAILVDADLDVRFQSAFALREFRPKRAVVPLVSVLSNPNEPASLRDVVAEVLAYIPDRRAITPLITALQDPDERVRRSAAYTLGGFANLLADTDLQPAIAPLITTLRDPADSVREQASRALAILGGQTLNCND